MKTKIVYFGTPHFAAEVLQYLLDLEVPIVGVVTQPDRPKGRSLQVTHSPVKELVLQKAPHISLLQPEKASEAHFLEELSKLGADLFVVVAYGQILPQRLLDIPPKGAINIHASLLPKYRGAAPIQRCLMDGEAQTGIAIQKMVFQLDAGDVIATSKVPISEETTFGSLERDLIEAAKPLLMSVLEQYDQGVPRGIPQQHSLATYATKIASNEGEVDWHQPAKVIHDRIRAFSPRPGAWCWIEVAKEKKRLKILHSKCVDVKGLPGQLLSNQTVGCADGALQLLEVQPEGKKAMSAVAWLHGQKNVSFLV